MRLLSLIFLFLFSTLALCQKTYQARVHSSSDLKLPYRILLPADISENKQYPLVLFLHGAGERGSDNQKQLIHGSQLFVDAQDEFPAVVLFPQCPVIDYWAQVSVNRNTLPFEFQFNYAQGPTDALKGVMSLLDSILATGLVDTDRVYLGGLSMGGMGTFELLHRQPETFAAAFAICGAGDTAAVRSYAIDFPIRIFHGGKDNVVLPSYSTSMYLALIKQGARVQFDLYPEANHNSWDRAFAEPELLSWLFSQRK